MRLAALALAALTALPAAAQTARPATYCNPLDLDYRYNFEQLNEGISYRSGADPVIVPFTDPDGTRAYYLFETIGDGYWRSTDLGTWTHVTPSRWPFEDNVAPAAIAVRDTIYLMQSATQPRPILATAAPATGRLGFYNRWLPTPPGAVAEGREVEGAGQLPPGPWDPALFHDAPTDRWYLYWGSSNVYPLYGVELDPRQRLRYTGDVHELLRLDPAQHGWERFGPDHRMEGAPSYMEGAWVIEHGGRYYLQYGAPGTEYNVYATGTYVGSSPLGPFTYAPYNPVAYKPGGFVTGAGHGNAFQDHAGNWWSTGTPWVGRNWTFERRIAMHPAAFTADGQFYADTRFGDFPRRLPDGPFADTGSLFTGWMLLSYRKPVTATSTRAAASDSFSVAHVTDENPRTVWVPETTDEGEGLTIDLGGLRTVRAVQVNYGDYRSGLFGTDSTVYTQFRLYASEDGAAWTTVADLTHERRDHTNAYVELERAVRARYVRFEHVYVGARHLAVSDVRVFGTADGPPPTAPQGLRVRRDQDPRNAFVSWQPVPSAVGYNVRWGVAPDRLFQTYQVWADVGTELEIRALTVGVGYSFAVEAFDERGVSVLGETVSIP